MSKQTLAIVTTDDASAPTPARRNLGKQQQRRSDATAALQEAVAQHQRVEKLIPNRQAITDRIHALENEQATLIEKWAMAGEGDSPKLPHVAEIEELKKQLTEADNVAAGTRAALKRMVETITAYQHECSQAIENIRAAADDVLVEIAQELADELDPLERRVALMRAHLIALQRHFELEGMRGRPVGNLSSVIARLIPRGPFELAPQSVEQIAREWNAFAGHLFNDNTAELELTK